MSQRFVVDDVMPSREVRPMVPLASRLGEHMVVAAPVAEVIETPDAHPLLAAVHVAFAEHRPLALSPDVVWLTIAQGVAQHVRLHAETLRPRLVGHPGKATLQITAEAVPTSVEEWAAVVHGFRRVVAERIGEGRARLFACDFSTTTPESAVAGDIVLMDAYSPYFDYELYCVCGIPEITLLGTPADWRAIRARIDVIDELELGFWTASLRPIADQLVATAEGRVDRRFWRSICKPHDAYGGERVTGWIARLYPYLAHQGRFDRRNPLLAVPMDGLAAAWRKRPEIGMALDQAPRGVSQVLIRLTGVVEQDVTLEGGLLGVSQDDEGRVAAVAGWLARPAAASIAAVIERLRAEHEVEAPLTPADGSRPRPFTGPAQLVALFEKIGGATIWPQGPHVWRVLSPSEHESIEIPGQPYLRLVRVIDMPNGTFLAHAYTPAGVRWAQLREDALGPKPSPMVEVGGILVRVHTSRPTAEPIDQIPVLHGDVADLLDFALQHPGSADLPRSGRTLADLVLRT